MLSTSDRYCPTSPGRYYGMSSLCTWNFFHTQCFQFRHVQRGIRQKACFFEERRGVILASVGEDMKLKAAASHPTPPAFVHDRALSRADYLFFGLDGLIVAQGPQSWRCDVCGIHTTDTDFWIQLALLGKPDHLLTLQLPLDSKTADAARAVCEWLSGALHADSPVRSHLQPVD